MKKTLNCYLKTEKLKPIGKFFYHLKIAKFWYDGDGVSFTWNLWNPLSWPILTIFLLVTILIDGISGFWKDKVNLGFCLSKYWKEHKDEREFI